jgi:hypothetical protein
MTPEDVEGMVDKAFPDDRIDFVPAAFLGGLKTLYRTLGIDPHPFGGAHPNCESAFILVSDGKEYTPITRLLKGSIPDALRALMDVETRLKRRVTALDEGRFGALLNGLRLKNTALYLLGVSAVIGYLRRHVRVGQLLKGTGPAKIGHALMAVLRTAGGLQRRNVIERHTNVQAFLEILILPFESRHNIETERMERCTTSFAFVDPRDDSVNFVPACAWWSIHKEEMMPLIAERYSKDGPNKEPALTPPSQAPQPA